MERFIVLQRAVTGEFVTVVVKGPAEVGLEQAVLDYNREWCGKGEIDDDFEAFLNERGYVLAHPQKVGIITF